MSATTPATPDPFRRLLLMVGGAQVLFTASDVIARAHFRETGFVAVAFLGIPFVLYLFLRESATIVQLRILSANMVGLSMALFSGAGLLAANVAGFLLLGEVPGPRQMAAVGLVLAAYAVIACRPTR